MPAYQVIIENKAQREFRKIPSPWNLSLQKRINSLEADPRPHGIKKLSGTTDGYRIRVGDYRILFTIDVHHKIITLYRIRNRKDA
jgi:mRNA interferase RelE/StbE